MAGNAYTLTLREGPKVTRERFATLAEALDGLERGIRGLAGRQHRETVDLRYREFTPMAQVATRAEIAGPGRIAAVRGGVDVRGDGSTEAYIGRVRRRLVEPRSGEDVYQALRRVLAK